MSMIREVRRVGSKGQVVIPKIFRESLGIKPGEDVNIIVEDGRLVIERQAYDVKKRLEEIAKHSRGYPESSDDAYEAMRDERWKKST